MSDRATVLRNVRFDFLNVLKWVGIVIVSEWLPLTAPPPDASVGERISQFSGVVLWVLGMNVLDHAKLPGRPRLMLGASIVAGLKLILIRIGGPVLIFWFYFPAMVVVLWSARFSSHSLEMFLVTVCDGCADLALAYPLGCLAGFVSRRRASG